MIRANLFLDEYTDKQRKSDIADECNTKENESNAKVILMAAIRMRILFACSLFFLSVVRSLSR